MTATSAAVHMPAPEVLRADQLDLVGRHSDAIDSLVMGVRRNDVEATTASESVCSSAIAPPICPERGCASCVKREIVAARKLQR